MTMPTYITWLSQFAMMLYFQTISGLQLEINQVVINNYNMTLVCRASTSIGFPITIEDPAGLLVTCSPSGFVQAFCDTSGYSIDETAKTVTLMRLAQTSDGGTWTCSYTSNPPVITDKNVTVETLVPINGNPLHINTTVDDGETITSATNDVFNAIYGCYSSAVKFEWKLAADSWQIVPQVSTVYTCATPGTSAYVSTQLTSEIWSHFSSGTKQTLSVTVLTMDNYELSVSTFSVYFSKGYTTTTPTLSTTKSTEKPQDICFGKPVPFSKDICLAFYILTGAFPFIIIIVIIIIFLCGKRKHRKENKHEDQHFEEQLTYIDKTLKNPGSQEVSVEQVVSKISVSKENEKQKHIDTHKNSHGIEHKRTGQMANANAPRNTEKSFANRQDGSRANLNQFDVKQKTHEDYKQNWDRLEKL